MNVLGMLASVTASSPSDDKTEFPQECDLVMKGGITSGIVYPLAIVEIAKAFRLRSIGGTSAGAIAAAAAAAAELGRRRLEAGSVTGNEIGFTKLEELPTFLSDRAANGRDTRLLAFFKPAPGLRPIFETLTAVLRMKGASARLLTATGVLVRRYKASALTGAALGTAPLWLLPFEWRMSLAWMWILVLGVACALGTVAWRALQQLLHELPKNGYGLCSGMPATDDPNAEESLTVWLSQYYDTLSGQRQLQASVNGEDDKHKPLTFGDLQCGGIDLQMMTTCLTLGRPFRLPFRDDEQVRENNQFLYKPEEFRKLFPANVVEWMLAHERDFKSDRNVNDRFSKVDFEGFHCLPSPKDLPVVVAVRMSLSFPVLLSAIPLYSIDLRRQQKDGEKPEVCWFTDGGVGSNFPIHFFDSPLPTRPTFGLDLGQVDHDSDKRVGFPDNNGEARLAYWRRFASEGGFGAIAGFLGTVVNVAKDWNHETLSHLPGFRDRIGLIRLTEEEGGLNLTMPKERIELLTDLGRQAGKEFVRRFGDSLRSHNVPPAKAMNWENHQLVRLRLFIAATVEQLEALRQAMQIATANPSMSYERFFLSGDFGPETYRFRGRGKLDMDPRTGYHTTQAGLAKWIFDDLASVAKRIEETTMSSDTPPSETSAITRATHPGYGAPKPTPELKLRPRV